MGPSDEPTLGPAADEAPPGAALSWIGELTSSSGVRERHFEVAVVGRRVPGILWTRAPGAEPSQVSPIPLVLIGHGATDHKRADYVLALARHLVGELGFAAAAIDGPGHGERKLDPERDEIGVFSDFLAEWSRDGTTDDVIAEWQATLDALHALDDVGPGPVGYWGLSMGTIYGVPFVVAEPRVKVAVLGLMGVVGPTRDRLAADAPRIACPVMFLQQWDDQLLPRDDVLALFDAIGALDKRLHAHPGDHAAVPPEELTFSVEFLGRHLSGGPSSPPPPRRGRRTGR